MDILDGFLSDGIEEEKIEETIKPHTIFDYVEDITYYKKGLLEKVMGENGNVFPSEITSYMLLKCLFNSRDTVLLANEMNIRYNIPVEIQYLFYDATIPSKKRYKKWDKVDKKREENISVISRYYGFSERVAELNLTMFSSDDIDQMKKFVEHEHAEKLKGGKK